MYENEGIILIDDEENILKSLTRLFRGAGYQQVHTAISAEEAAKLLKTEADGIYLAITDERMPKVRGSDLAKYIRQHYPHIVRIVLTGYSEPESMIKAINEGEVFRYLTKPWVDEELLATVKEALEYAFLKRDNQRLQNELKEKNKDLERQVMERTEELSRTLERTKDLNVQLSEANQQAIRIIAVFMESIHPGIIRRGQQLLDGVQKIITAAELNPPEYVFNAALFYDLPHINSSTLRRSIPQLFQMLPSFRPMDIIISLIHARPVNNNPVILEGSDTDLNQYARIIACIHELQSAAGNQNWDVEQRKILESWKSFIPERILIESEKFFLMGLGKPRGDQDEHEADTAMRVAHRVKLFNLHPGMKTAEGLYLTTGVMLLPPDTVLDARQILIISQKEELQLRDDGIKIYNDTV